MLHLAVVCLFCVFFSLDKCIPFCISGEGAVFGVDINNGGIIDTFSNFVWEPAVVKVSLFCTSTFSSRGLAIVFHLSSYSQLNAINAATEAACLILSVDETIRNPKVSRCYMPTYVLLYWYETC